mmetsp:Transcript_23019/g.58169  ORF Transcript_23019/g.58169 Transcript_23019/m.58169 type:complete len:674 (+) Transcript_23019:210-2231(+)|eukprot:CAMPEP_0178987498 /NCGR_PEP_ID=MMETSP0795-20121207/3298_1 /TAXON_ID=88552 /ORGANISM="Amoebophrya sp., Strain Ameob2" /LENGTH=673 /DNA_ID=CAMNT_0020678687 /DNA_START=187 /DNA_END=2208 /DNA_ORIENTATION=-
MPSEVFEVLFPVQHRGSTQLDDKLIGKAKKGEIVTGELIEGGQWLRLADQMAGDVFVPTEVNGKQIVRSSRGPSGGGRAGAGCAGAGTGSRFINPQAQELGVVGAGSAGTGTGAAFPAAVPTPGSRSAGSRLGGAPADELERLHALGDKKFGAPRGPNKISSTTSSQAGRCRGPPRYSAASSHERNDAYMQEFERGLQDNGVTDVHLDPFLHVQKVQDRAFLPGEVAGSAMPVAGPGNANAKNAARGAVGAGSGLGPTSISSGGKKSLRLPATTESQWQSVKHGQPTINTAAGRWVDVSDRNVLCMAASGQSDGGGCVVVGSCDHLLKEIDVHSGTVVRSFYSERKGHRDWVTTCCYSGSTVISGGADSRICVWESSTTASRGSAANSSSSSRVARAAPICHELLAHTGSISRVRAQGQGRRFVSSSYDKTLRIWDLRTKRELCTLAGHTAPVLDFVWPEEGNNRSSNLLLSGDRSGICRLWDVNAPPDRASVGVLKGHKGHITALAVSSSAAAASPCYFSGAQDGHVRMWDARSASCVRNFALHTGAVNDILLVVGAGGTSGNETMITVGADNVLKWTDLSSDRDESTFHEIGNISSDFVYAAMLFNETTLALGDGHGHLSLYDVKSGMLVEGESQKIAANAIRCVEVVGDTLIAAGDDGNVQFFDKAVAAS